MPTRDCLGTGADPHREPQPEDGLHVPRRETLTMGQTPTMIPTPLDTREWCPSVSGSPLGTAPCLPQAPLEMPRTRVDPMQHSQALGPDNPRYSLSSHPKQELTLHTALQCPSS